MHPEDQLHDSCCHLAYMIEDIDKELCAVSYVIMSETISPFAKLQYLTLVCLNQNIRFYDDNTSRLYTVDAYLLTYLLYCGGLALVSINVVTLRRARLILGWVTVCGRVNHLGITSHLGQLSLSSFQGR